MAPQVDLGIWFYKQIKRKPYTNTFGTITGDMNKLDYSISLREKGLVSNDIKKMMKEKGFEESEIQYYLKKSDEIFLNQLIHNKRSKSKGKFNMGAKMMALTLSLLLLISAFFGYVRIGLLGLFIIWTIVGYSSNKR